MRLIEFRYFLKLSQAEVGQALGITQAMVSKIELDMVYPSQDVAQRIADWSGGMVTPNDQIKVPGEDDGVWGVVSRETPPAEEVGNGDHGQRTDH